MFNTSFGNSATFTLPETEPATSKEIVQAHILQALKTLCLEADWLEYGGCSFVPVGM